MNDPGPPRWTHSAAELPRAAFGVGRLIQDWRALGAAPPGDGRPVMVLPGLGNSDRSNVVMRRHLTRIGYTVEGWGLGRNFGTRAVGPEAERLLDRVQDYAARAGEPVTMVGVSLGGILSRIVAHRRPDLVAGVITVSSPFAGPPTATRVWRAFELLSGEKITDPAVRVRLEEAARPLTVPTAAVWSASDGLVNGLICRPDADPDCRTVRIDSGHIGVQLRPALLNAVSALLADMPRGVQRSGSDAR